MLAHRLACIATVAIALLAGATPALGWPSTCAPAEYAPAPPGPLQGHPIAGGFQLEWKDLANPQLDIAVDGYLVFRAPLDEMAPPDLIAEVGSLQHAYVDQGASVGDDYLYWVAAHNCEGFSPSNLISTLVASCVDWQVNLNSRPPLEAVWADTDCTIGGGQCHILVVVFPPDVQHQGCGLDP
ncbi:MAG: hypothetical protein LC623_06525 [Halobacteriales archaeon]|nr:hypothetical protein [Halobacteriales archaeon]